MGMSSYCCMICGRDLMSYLSYEFTPDWMTEVVVFMPDGEKIEGEYSGYMSVITDNPTINKYAYPDHADRNVLEGESNIWVYGDQFYDPKLPLQENMFRSAHCCGPTCYHRKCWELAGKPDGYRGPSMNAPDQGFGTAADFFFMEGMDEDTGEPIPYHHSKTPVETLWAVTAVSWFLYRMYVFAVTEAVIAKDREVFSLVDRILSDDLEF